MPQKDFNIRNEKDCFRQIALMLDEQDVSTTVTDEEILQFLRRSGVLLVPKIKQLVLWAIRRARKKQIMRAVVKACRGGGKTFSIASGVEFALFYFFDYDCVNLGGSKAQADKAYSAIQDIIQLPDVNPTIESSIQTRTKKKNGTWIAVLATSSTSVRSPHAGNPGKGGLLFIDEECEIKDQTLVNSAKPVVNTADPSAIIRASTQHKLDDTFEELWNNAKKQGYTRFSWDAFDVCQHCTRKCWVSYDEDPKNGCHDGLRKDTYDNRGNLIRKGYCKGKAHHDGWIYECDDKGEWTKKYDKVLDWKDESEGWIQISEILQAFVENDSETFEVEYLGQKRRRKGKVYDSELIDEACEERLEITLRQFKQCHKSIGIDWGYAGETAVTYSFLYRNCIYIYWIEYYTQTDLDIITDAVKGRANSLEHNEAYADSAGPFENAKLADHLAVFSVVFSQWKDFGVKNTRNFLEKKRVKILSEWMGQPNPGYEHFIEQMKGYRYDEHGNYYKKNDHGPDAILCNLLKWAPRRRDIKGKRNRTNREPRMFVV